MNSQSPNLERRPEIVGIEITRVCNLNCPHCYTAAGRRPMTELSTKEVSLVLDQLADLGPARAIGWTGGEPLLRDDLVKLVSHAYRNGGMRSGVTTNGLLLDRVLARRLRDAGAYAIQISVDASTAEGFAKIRGARIEEFEVVLEAMEAVREAGLQLHLAFVLGKETLEDARNFIKLAEERGAVGVRFCGFVPSGRGKRRDMIERFEFGTDLSDLRTFITEAMANTRLMVMFDPAFGPLPPDYGFHECVAGMQTMYVSSTGGVYPCTSLISPRFEIGNVKEKTLAEIWSSPRMTEVADFDRSHIEGECSHCDRSKECHGGCRGIALARAGNFSAALPGCLYPGAPALATH